MTGTINISKVLFISLSNMTTLVASLIISHFIDEEMEALRVSMSGARWQGSVSGSLILEPMLLITM